jgi:hypothetical protein
MSRITSQDGNVIAAEFGARPVQTPKLAINFKTTILYCDPHVCLIRIAYFSGEKLIGIQHVMTDLSNNMDVPS